MQKRGKRVVFVEPRGAYSNVFTSVMTIPLLGPLYLGKIAKQAGYDVSILNENILGRKIKQEELKDVDILCLTCITATIERGREIAKQYKSIRKSLGQESKVIIGGIHASMLPRDVHDYFDQVAVGEGEKIILDLLENKIKDKIVYAERLENLDNLPIPDFKMIKQWWKIRIFPVMTSRGCPHNCNFCSITKMFGRGYRAQNPERVVKEIEIYNGKKIFIADDHFAANPVRLEKILDLMIKKKLKIHWSSQLRADISKHPKIVEKMKKAGCDTVQVGFESINPQSLIEINKGQTVKDIEHSIRIFHDNGILILGMFMFGSDSDTKDIFKKTSEFCRKNKVDFLQGLALSPIAGTELYTRLEKEGRLLHKKWQYYDGLHVVHKPKQMTEYELQRGLIEFYKNHYSYSEGIKDMLKVFAARTVATIKNIISKEKVFLPSFEPPLAKIVGTTIVKNWLKHNKDYLRYLKKNSESI